MDMFITIPYGLQAYIFKLYTVQRTVYTILCIMYSKQYTVWTTGTLYWWFNMRRTWSSKTISFRIINIGHCTLVIIASFYYKYKEIFVNSFENTFLYNMSVKGTVHTLYVMHYQHYCTIYIIQCILYTTMYILHTCSRYNALTVTLTYVVCTFCTLYSIHEIVRKRHGIATNK